MPNKETTPQSLYGNGREFLREQIRTNEILAEIAGSEYTPPEGVPKGKYMEQKWLLDAAQKKNDLLEEIAETGGGSGGANGLAIDYGTDVLSLKKGDAPIPNSGVTLPAYGLNYNSATGGLTLTKNGTAIQDQTVSLPAYGSPLTANSPVDMTDTDKVYVYTGTTSGGYVQGHWYYYDGDSWEDGGTYNSQGIDTDKTLLVADAPADAKATGDAVAELKTQLNHSKTVTPGYVMRATNEGLGTEWAQVGTPTDEQAETAINAWLNAHPEATTTVQDNSLTWEKLNSTLKQSVQKYYDNVSSMKSDSSLSNNQIVGTKGYYNINDGGDGIYIIKTTNDTTKWSEELNNGLYAVLISDITFKTIGMIENQNNDSIMAKLITLVQNNEDTEQFIVIVDGHNFEFTTIRFTNIWNLTLTAPPSGRGHVNPSEPHIICESITYYVAFNCKLHGLNISGILDSNEQPTDSVIKYRSTCRNCIVEQCYIINGTTGIDIGTTENQDDTASIIIEKTFLFGNNIGISCNSGNGRVQARSNVIYSKTNNIVIYGGVNIFEGNVSDIPASYQSTFDGDIKINGGGLTLIGHDCDCPVGYMVKGAPSLPVVISGCRHYDDSMSLQTVPNSIDLYGSTTVTIDGCYLYNNININVGSNYKATINGCYLRNGSITGTGKVVIINSDGNSTSGTIRNANAKYAQNAVTLNHSYGLLAELMKGDSIYTQVEKTQNGIALHNNTIKKVDGTEEIVNQNAPKSEYLLEDKMTFNKYYNDTLKMVFRANLDADIPFISIGDKKIYFSSQAYMTQKNTGDIKFTGGTTSPFIQVWDGTQWLTIL